MLAPIELLGPISNYVFLRYFGGDKEKEKYQTRRYSESHPAKFDELVRFRAEKNAFWPQLQEFGNKWLWTIVGAGAAGVLVEEVFRGMH
jgi:hypothetical protein